MFYFFFLKPFASMVVNYSCETVHHTSCELQEHVHRTAVLPNSGGAALKDSLSPSLSSLPCKSDQFTLGDLETINRRPYHVETLAVGSRYHSKERTPYTQGLLRRPGVHSAKLLDSVYASSTYIVGKIKYNK